MPRAKPSRLPLSAQRITAYVTAHFPSRRAAADALGVNHVTLWKAMQGHTVRGPSAELCEALEAHTGTAMRFWRGSDL